MQLYTIVLVARAPIMRAGIRSLLAGVSDLSILGEAVDRASLAAQLAEHTPGVVVLCLDQEQSVTELIQLSKTLQPATKVVLLAQSQTPEAIRSYLTAGIDGYVPFGLEQAALAKVIRDVMHYGLVLAEQVVEAVRSPALIEPTPPLLALLSAREQEVLQQVAEGRTNLEIAERLSISADTVRTHLKHIYDKLAINSRPALIRFAMQAQTTAPHTAEVNRG